MKPKPNARQISEIYAARQACNTEVRRIPRNQATLPASEAKPEREGGKLDSKILESQVEKEVIQWLKDHNAWWRRTKAEQSFNKQGHKVTRLASGFSDLIAMVPAWPSRIDWHGRLWAIECKRPVGGVLSVDQAKFLLSVLQAGGVITIARSTADLELSLIDRGASFLPEILAIIKRGSHYNSKNDHPDF